MQQALSEFMAAEMVRGSGKRFVPARLQAALALLEKLRESPDLDLERHMAKPGSAGLKSHEKYGDDAIERHGLEALNRNHGRRSSDLRNWGGKLLKILQDSDFADASEAGRSKMIDMAQQVFADKMRWIINEEPLKLSLSGGFTAAALIRQVLERADEKGKAGDVAQYLVGAKLELRLDIKLPKRKANKGDRKSYADPHARAGDFEIEDAVIEVALGAPDEKHLTKIAEALDGTNKEFWILTRHDRVAAWMTEVNGAADDGVEARRVVVASVDNFVGQNVTELGGFGSKARSAKLRELFRIYNDEWVGKLGLNGIRVVIGS